MYLGVGGQVESDGRWEMAGSLTRSSGRGGDRFRVRRSTGKGPSHGCGLSAPGEGAWSCFKPGPFSSRCSP